jgi:hypothetical protein
MTRTPTNSVTAVAARAFAWDVPGSAHLSDRPSRGPLHLR